MRGNRRLAQGIAISGIIGMLAITATISQPQMTKTENTVEISDNGTAGVIAAFANNEQIADMLAEDEVSIELNDVDRVGADLDSLSTSAAEESKKDGTASGEKSLDSSETEITTEGIASSGAEISSEGTVSSGQKASSEETASTVAEENKEEEQKAAEEQQEAKKLEKWQKRLMADVDEFLYIRKSADKDSKIVGKLYKGDLATIVKQGKTWTKIKSGSVKGYVKNKYCVTGEDAYKLAKKICKTCAVVQTDGLRVRDQADEDSSILKVTSKGDKLTVNTKAEEEEGWVAVKISNKTSGYVNEDYVKVGLDFGEAISIEEEQKAAQKKSTAAVAVSNSDLKLLAAIIYCEAGGESYQGQVAVGAVVLNRVKSSSFPGSVSSVIRQRSQFSPVGSGAFDRTLSNGNYQHCIEAAQAALAGSDPTGGKLFFHRVNGRSGVVIGHHVFY